MTEPPATTTRALNAPTHSEAAPHPGKRICDTALYHSLPMLIEAMLIR